MNLQQKGKIKILIDHEYIGYSSGFNVTREKGGTVLNIIPLNRNDDLETPLKHKENYESFFAKITKAFKK